MHRHSRTEGPETVANRCKESQRVGIYEIAGNTARLGGKNLIGTGETCAQEGRVAKGCRIQLAWPQKERQMSVTEIHDPENVVLTDPCRESVEPMLRIEPVERGYIGFHGSRQKRIC